MFPWNLTIAANETMPVAASGSFVYVDKATGPVKLEAYNDGKRVAEVPLSFAREANLPFFTKLYVTDTSGAENTVRLLVGGENEGYERNGSEITGPVGNAGGVRVEDTGGGGESFAEILALLKNAADQRAPLTTFAGASSAEASGADITIASAAENTNGVIIRRATAFSKQYEGGTVETASLEVDGINLLASGQRAQGTNNWAVTSGPSWIENVFIPPGQEIVAKSDSAKVPVSIWYEVL